MDHDVILIETIERYLNDQMADAERIAFEQHIQADPALAEAVQDYAKILEGMRANMWHKFQDNVKQWETEAKATDTPLALVQSPKKVAFWPKFAKYAAAVLVFAVAGTAMYMNLNAGKSNAELFATYYNPDVQTMRNGGESNASLPFDSKVLDGLSQERRDYFAKAYDTYALGSYSQALELFEKFRANKTAKLAEQQALYFEAICKIGLEDEFAAIKSFDELLAVTADVALIDKASWYKALLLLKNGERKSAKKILTEIQFSSSSPYAHQAASLLKEF
jgi:tetratricopeptide (TPR) repeat protein